METDLWSWIQSSHFIILLQIYCRLPRLQYMLLDRFCGSSPLRVSM